MALSHEENEMLTRVGPGTPGGEMLRRYWHPIAFLSELRGKPLRRRILGEDLVLFRDDRGRVGLLTLRCSHRGTSLEFGHLENGGLRCCYHGWLYDVEGRILETPGEPADSTFKERVPHPAYKVQELAGIVFAYLGPEPAPLLPRYDVLVREDGVRSMSARIVHCNFLQMVENSVDQHHFKWLHRTPKTRQWREEKLTSDITDFGILDTFTRRVGDEYFRTISLFVMPNMNKVGYHLPEDHPAAFAATHEGYEALRWRVPVDDVTTMHFTLYFAPFVDGKVTARIPKDQQEQGLGDSIPGKYQWDEETGWIARGDQDRCAQESQGAILDRTAEHLAVSDEGVILLRRLFKQSIEAVRKGEDPVGVIRDPAKNEILRLVPGEYKLDNAK
jgi:Phenylpropionate dioxygenase and related ring-hydroxylating dioxygenases, large terminal subunit